MSADPSISTMTSLLRACLTF